MVLKPLGEALTKMPSGVDDFAAGPSFTLVRHVMLPHDPEAAYTVVRERLDALLIEGERLIKQNAHPMELEKAIANLQILVQTMQ